MDSFTRSARSPYWPLVEIAGSLYYSPIKKAVNALERGQTRQISVIGVERRENSLQLTPTRDFHSNNNFN